MRFEHIYNPLTRQVQVELWSGTRRLAVRVIFTDTTRLDVVETHMLQRGWEQIEQEIRESHEAKTAQSGWRKFWRNLYEAVPQV